VTDVELLQKCLDDVMLMDKKPDEFYPAHLQLAIALFNHRVRFLPGDPLAASKTNGSD